MSLHLKTGKPGGGKSLVVVKDNIIPELVYGHRRIVTNLPIRLGPWVAGDGKTAMLGLRAYLEREYGESFDVDKRLKVVEDIEEGHDLFLWRYHEEKGWFKCDVVKDQKGVKIEFDTKAAAMCEANLIVTDEAWKYYPARRWMETGPMVEFYARQHRKFNDIWILITQNTKDVDVSLQRLCQDFTICRNHGYERMGIFRQPKQFTISTYIEPPTSPTVTRVHWATFRLDLKGLAQTYDTAAGVGINSGASADQNRKQPGLNMIWLFVGLIIGMLGLAMLPKMMGKAASSILAKGMSGIKKPHTATNLVQQIVTPLPSPTNSTNERLPAAVTTAAGLTRVTPPLPEAEVWLTGLTWLGKNVEVWLSDGRKFTNRDRELQFVGSDRVVIDRVVYRFRPAAPKTQQPTSSSLMGFARP